MNWYYAKDGQQQGPVDDAELARLVAAKTIIGTTLVWREGMGQWQAYQEVWVAGMPEWQSTSAAVPPVAPPPAASASGPSPDATQRNTACAECQQLFPSDQLTLVAGRPVCAACKPVATQRLQAAPTRPGAEAPASGLGFSVMDPDTLVRNSGARALRLDPMGCFQRSWNLLKRDPLLTMGSVAIALFLMMAGGAIPFLSFCIGLVVNTPLMGGVWSLFLKALRGQSVSFEEVFAGFSKRWVPLILSGILQIVISAVAIGPFGGLLFFWFQSHHGATPAGLDLVLVVVVSLILVLVSAYINLAMFFAVPLVMDRGYGVLDAFNTSRRIANQNIPGLLVLALLTFLLLIGGVLALCVGLVVAVPLVMGTWAAAYEQLCGSEVPPA